MKRKVFLAVGALLAVALSGALWQQRKVDAAPAIEKKGPRELQPLPHIKAYEITTLDAAQLPSKAGGLLSLVTPARRWDLELSSSDVVSPRYRAEESLGRGEVRALAAPEVELFKGRVAGIPNTHVRLSRQNGVIEGLIMTPDEQYYFEPANRYLKEASPGELLLYRAADVISDEKLACGTELKDAVEQQKRGLAKTVGAKAASNSPQNFLPFKVVEIATEADYEYVQTLNGSSAQTNSQILTIMNMVSGVYEVETGITIRVVYQHTWPTPNDPYLNEYVDLFEFRTIWENDFAGVHRDLAHLFSGRFYPGAAGMAYLSVACSTPSLSYAWTRAYGGEFSFRPVIVAHEIGHNFGANHTNTGTHPGCGGTIMNVPLGQLTFCQFSRDVIIQHAASNSGCLSNNLRTPFDFDGDGKTDISVFRPETGDWWVLQSSDNAAVARHWGLGTDKLTPADYDRDGKTDLAVFRPSEGIWYINQSVNNELRAQQWGLNGDVPRPAYYDADNAPDLAVFRPGDAHWYIFNSYANNSSAFPFGLSDDHQVSGDYDGDGRDDVAVWRPSNGVWYILQSSNGAVRSEALGTNVETAVPGDYDGDRKIDLAVYNPNTGVWQVKRSIDGVIVTQQFGQSLDQVAPGDYDGDGKTDFAVWRPIEGNTQGLWYILRSSNGSLLVQQFGLQTDKPVPAAYIQ
jgi:hypothetical protein